MTLENRFYRIISNTREEGRTIYKVALLPDCDVYKGHFPGDPVCPGVCNIQTIKELVAKETGHEMTIRAIKRCRLTAIATPVKCDELDITIAITSNDNDSYAVQADIKDAHETYMVFMGTMD